ncbi:RibD family protein, partial [bacterium]|nr:RibD family protein [bacterium]
YIQPSFLTKKNILEKKRYYKIVLDPYLKTPPDAKLFENEKAKVLIFVSENIPEEKITPFKTINNCEIIKAEIFDGKFKMKSLMEILYEKKIGIIMVEGGEKTLTSFWNEKLADKVMVFIGNKILGGEKALVPIAGRDKEKIEEAVKIEELDIKKIGNNLVIEGKPCFQE